MTTSTPIPEIIGRVVAVYLGLLVMVRMAGKREIGQLGALDLLGMLLLSETVSPALTGQDDSLLAALVAAGTLLALAGTIGRLTYWSPGLERLIDGEPRRVIFRGKIDRKVCAGERITEQELCSALRQAGVGSIAEVEEATVEPTGSISVVKRS